MPSMVKLMQQHWITATEDLALVIQMFSSRQAAYLLGRACEEKGNCARKGHRGNYVKKGEMGAGRCYWRIKNTGYIAFAAISLAGGGLV